MDLHTLVQAQMELMGNDQPVASCGLHGATRRDVIEQAIEYLYIYAIAISGRLVAFGVG